MEATRRGNRLKPFREKPGEDLGEWTEGRVKREEATLLLSRGAPQTRGRSFRK